MTGKEKTNLCFNIAAVALVVCSVVFYLTCNTSGQDKMKYDLTPCLPCKTEVPKEFDMTPYLDMTPECKDGVCPAEVKVVTPKATVKKNSSCANGSCTTTRSTKTRTWRGPFGRRWTVYRRR